MAKKLQEWLDDFIENGFSSDVSHWPEEGSVETNQPSVNITPSTSAQTILPDEGYIGFDQAVVAAVDNTIDNNIQAENIKKDVTILGVTGNYEAPEVPAYTGPYTITENGTIAINGKQATQDINVEVPSASYTNEHIYYADRGILIDQNAEDGYWYRFSYGLKDGIELDDNRVYFLDDNNQFITNEYGGSGYGVYIVDYDSEEGKDFVKRTDEYVPGNIYLATNENFSLTTNSSWTYSGSNVFYILGGSGGVHPSEGLYNVGYEGEYEGIDLPDNDLQGETFEYGNDTYDIIKGIGSGLYDATDFFTGGPLVEVTTGVEDDHIYWKEDGNWNSYDLSNGEIVYRDYDNDSIYNLGSWGGSGIYQVEENGTTSIELEVNESTEVTVDGKTYTITRTI